MTVQNDRISRSARALESLAGLSVGDSFGQRMFGHDMNRQSLPPGPWQYTDDTTMALSVVEILKKDDQIDPDALAASFAERYDPMRGYGPAMHYFLARLRAGDSWRELAPALFQGQGSFGNGASMRVAPLGAYFADDLDLVVEQAGLSARVTHAHPEGIAGAVAVAVAAACAARLRGRTPDEIENTSLIASVLPYVPESEVRRKLEEAAELSCETKPRTVAALLGNGSKISAQDTVPFCLWSANSCKHDFPEALWRTASVYGDIDTNCAIVGGVLASVTGSGGVPASWRQRCEELPNWATCSA